VSGTITRCALQHDVQPRVGSAQPDAHTYRPRVEYSYTVDGQEHVGSRVFFGAHEWRGGSSEFAEWLLIEYPVGTKVQVFVDPNDTTEAVLERGRDDVAKGYLRIAMYAAVGAAIAFVVAVV
jgi:hypothetical protein